MTTDTDKLVEMAREHGFCHRYFNDRAPEFAQLLAAFRAAIIADLCVDVEPGYAVIEAALANAQKGDPNNSPFGMMGDHGLAYQSGLAAAYQHALEMIPASTVAALKAERDALRAAGKVLTDYILSSPSGCLPQSIVTAIAALTKGQPAPQPQQEQSNG